MILAWCAGALAAPVLVGVGVGGALDLPDARLGTDLGPGPAGGAVVELALGGAARLRFATEVSFAAGSQQLSWPVSVDGELVALAEPADGGVALAGGTVGLGLAGRTRFAPYAAAGLGALAAVGWHTLGPDASEAVVAFGGAGDRASTLSAAPLAELTLGVAWQPGERGPSPFAELGYGAAWVRAATIEGGVERDPWAWNPVRLLVGLRFGRVAPEGQGAPAEIGG